MRILMFAPAFVPMNNPEAIVNGKLALALLNNGYELDIISKVNETDYNYSSKIDEIWIPLKERSIFIDLPKYRGVTKYISYIYCFLSTGHPIQGCRWAFKAYKTSLQLVKNKKYDIILSRAMPDCAHLPALLLAKYTGIPWIANWNDPHDEKAPHPWEKTKNFSFFRKNFNNSVIKNADWHTFPSNKLRVYMSNYLGTVVLEKSSVIEHISINVNVNNSIDSEYFDICYAGALYTGRDPSSFLRCIEELRNENVKFNRYVRLFFIGKFGNWFFELIKKYGLDNITSVIDSVSYMESLEYMSKMTLFFLLETNYTQGIFCPSKIVDYYQLSKPIIAIGAKDSEVEEILHKFGGGVYIPHNENKLLKNKLLELFSLWQENKLGTIVEHSNLKAKFSPETIIMKYDTLFMHLKS